MNLQEALMEKQDAFFALCRKYKVKKLYAFGSSVTARFDESRSDIDLLVEVDINDPVEKGKSLLSVWDGFESLFERKVDLLTEASIRNPYLKVSIEKTRKLIYDGRKSISTRPRINMWAPVGQILDIGILADSNS